MAGAIVSKIKNPIIDFAPFGCSFLLVVFAVSRSKLLQAVVPLCFPAPLVFVPAATPPPVHYFVSLRLHFGRSLGGYVRNGSRLNNFVPLNRRLPKISFLLIFAEVLKVD